MGRSLSLSKNILVSFGSFPGSEWLRGHFWPSFGPFKSSADCLKILKLDQKLDQNALQVILSQAITRMVPKIFWEIPAILHSNKLPHILRPKILDHFEKFFLRFYKFYQYKETCILFCQFDVMCSVINFFLNSEITKLI